MRNIVWSCSACAAIVLIELVSGPALGASLTRLVPLDGTRYTVGRILSDDGSIAIGASLTNVVDGEGFFWDRANGMRAISGLPGDHWDDVRDVSADGSTVLGSNHEGAYLWDATHGRRTIERPPSGSSVFVRRVSGDGTTVVGGVSYGGALVWDAENGARDIGRLPGGYSTIALDVSRDGSTIVGRDVTQYGEEAFVWTAATGIQRLREPEAGNTFAAAVSADGSTVVGTAVFPQSRDAFVWTAATGIQSIGALPGEGLFYGSQATDVSADGSVVVGISYDGQSTTKTFVWDAQNGMRDLDVVMAGLGLDLAGWRPNHHSPSFHELPRISADGTTILSTGNYNGWRAAYVVVIPEPSTVVLIGGGLMVLTLREARRR